MEIRENLLNKGDVRSLSLLLTDSFQERKSYIDQLHYRQLYFSDYSYAVNSIDIKSYSPFFKRALLVVNYNLSFKSPQDIDVTFWLNRLEEVTLLKEKIGWKIDKVKELKEHGTKIEPQTVHDIFFALDTRKEALCNNDLQLFETALHPDYPQRNKMIEEFKENLETFSNVSYNLKNRYFFSFSPQKNETTVVQYYDLTFTLKGSGKAQKVENQKEMITLKKNQTGTWQIVAGLK